MNEEVPQTEKCIDRRPPLNTCTEWGHEYPPSKSRSIVIRGPSEVYCGCPECGHRSLGIIPEMVAHPPDADRDAEREDTIYGLSDQGDPGSLTDLNVDEDENEDEQ